MNWPWKKKKLSFAEIAKFNWEADTNTELRQKTDQMLLVRGSDGQENGE